MESSAAIMIDNLSLTLSVGLLDHEREVPQRVIVSMRLLTDVTYLKNPDTFIDYGAICERLKRLETAPHVELVETLAVTILDIAFEYDAVNKTFLKITKPDIIPDADHVGVEMMISRTDYENVLKL